MSITAVYALSSEAGVVFSREYRNAAPNPSDTQHRIISLLAAKVKQGDLLSPVFRLDEIKTSFCLVQKKDLFLFCAVQEPCNAVSVFVFADHLLRVLESYFGSATAEALRDNFTVVYEILDEVLEFGYIQTTDEKALQEYVLQKTFGLFPVAKDIPQTLSVAENISWRRPGILYTRNEVYLDVVETVSIAIDEEGNAIRTELTGTITANCRLSGMPTVAIGLNDRRMLSAATDNDAPLRVELNNVRFHHCVDLSKFDNERAIRFIPPDGVFDLLTYSFSGDIARPLEISCSTEAVSETRCVYNVQLCSLLGRDVSLFDVSVFVPVPADAVEPLFKNKTGAAAYLPEQNAVRWKLPAVSSRKRHCLSITVSLPRLRIAAATKRGPVTVSFRIPCFACSGLQIRYLRVVDASYTANSWVRYLSQNGSYEAKIQQL